MQYLLIGHAPWPDNGRSRGPPPLLLAPSIFSVAALDFPGVGKGCASWTCVCILGKRWTMARFRMRKGEEGQGFCQLPCVDVRVHRLGFHLRGGWDGYAMEEVE